MGACLSCLSCRLFDCRDNEASTVGGRSCSTWSHHFRRLCCLPSCCGTYEVLFPAPQDEQDAASAESGGPLSQSVGLLDGTSAIACRSSPHDMRNRNSLSSLLRHDKSCMQTQIGQTHRRESRGIASSGLRETLVIDQAKVIEQSGDQMNARKLPPSYDNGKSEAITSLLDDEDICPTCLEGYDQENPRIITKCNHHFHLACILEWMERSIHCPLCDQKMEFNESP